MTFQELVERVRSGERIPLTFKKAVEDLECYAESGMRAVLFRATRCQHDLVELAFDYSQHEAHNQTLESRNYYYDDKGQPTLNAREAGYYRVIEHVYFDLDSDPSAYFELGIAESAESLLRALCAAAYQIVGAIRLERDIVPLLDLLSAAGDGKPITREQVDALLPYVQEEQG